jgi:hypothetical protein
MEIPLKAKVECADGICGRSEYVLINPVVDQVTHVVVKENASPHQEVMVPLEALAETGEGRIRLRCRKKDLEKMEPFLKSTVVEEKQPDVRHSYPAGLNAGIYFLPYLTPESTVQMVETQLQVPPGELVIERGVRVEATDGSAGQVDDIRGDTVVLKLDRGQVEALPSFPLHWRWV